MNDISDCDPLEQLEELRMRIPEAKKRLHFGKVLDHTIRAVAEAEQVISELEQMDGFIPLVREHLEPEDSTVLRDILLKVQRVGKRLTDATDVNVLNDTARELTHAIPVAISQAGQLIKRGWLARINEAFASTGRLGGVLREIPETRQLGIEMESLSERVKKLSSPIADAMNSGKEFESLRKDRDQIHNKLTSLGAGEEVVAFLLAVADQSATLMDVTGEVREWLFGRSALRRFKVGL